MIKWTKSAKQTKKKMDETDKTDETDKVDKMDKMVKNHINKSGQNTIYKMVEIRVQQLRDDLHSNIS